MPFLHGLQKSANIYSSATVENRIVRVFAWLLILGTTIPLGSVVHMVPDESAFRVVLSKSTHTFTTDEVLMSANRVFHTTRIALFLLLLGSLVALWHFRKRLPESVVIAWAGFVLVSCHTCNVG